jgi:hypothetical protein
MPQRKAECYPALKLPDKQIKFVMGEPLPRYMQRCVRSGPFAFWVIYRAAGWSLRVFARRDDHHTRERRPWVPPREYFTGFRFGSIFVRPVPLLTSMI